MCREARRQIRQEVSPCNQLLDGNVRGDDEANVDRGFAICTNRANHLPLDEGQEAMLHRTRDLADFVEKQGSATRTGHEPVPRRRGTGEGAPHMPEKVRAREGVIQCCDVDLDERSLASSGRQMHNAGERRLASSGLALQ